MNSLVVISCLVAVACAMPQSVLKFEAKRAPLKLRFDPYDVTWEQFKQEHGKLIVIYSTHPGEEKK